MLGGRAQHGLKQPRSPSSNKLNRPLATTWQVVARGFRPITLSNAGQKVVARARYRPHVHIASHVCHESQRTCMEGGLLLDVLDGGRAPPFSRAMRCHVSVSHVAWPWMWVSCGSTQMPGVACFLLVVGRYLLHTCHRQCHVRCPTWCCRYGAESGKVARRMVASGGVSVSTVWARWPSVWISG